VALGGEPVIDSFTAMSYFPIFDGRRWDPAELSRIGITEDQLPIVVTEIGATARHLSGLTGGSDGGDADGQGAARTSLAPGSVDVMTEQITAGVSQPGEAHIMCGTTLLTWAVMPDEGDVPGLWRIPHLRPGLCLLGGPSNAGGLFLGWTRRLLGGTRTRASTGRGTGISPGTGTSPRTSASPGTGISPGTGGLHPDRIPLWTPYVRGERIPLHNTSLRGSLHGLDLTHDATALRRAAYEATGFVARRILDMAGCVPARVVATGGGTRDRAWMQALADCTGVPVIRAAVPEGAALGMAWMARIAAGLESSLDDAARWSRPGRPVYPDERWARACSRRYEQFRELTAAIRTY
jgi:xylulokinase